MNLGDHAATPSERFRLKLLEAMLEVAPDLGWTPASLQEASERCGLTQGEADLACPGGVGDLLEEFHHVMSAMVGRRLGEADLVGMKIRDKVTFGVRAYLEALEPFRPAVRRAIASPLGLFAGPRGLWGVADAIWSGLGDRSTDFNWYSKRTILSGVIASTLLVWLAGDAAETEAFLQRRIADVMTFEKTKSKVRSFFTTSPTEPQPPGSRS